MPRMNECDPFDFVPMMDKDDKDSGSNSGLNTPQHVSTSVTPNSHFKFSAAELEDFISANFTSVTINSLDNNAACLPEFLGIGSTLTSNTYNSEPKTSSNPEISSIMKDEMSQFNSDISTVPATRSMSLNYAMENLHIPFHTIASDTNALSFIMPSTRTSTTTLTPLTLAAIPSSSSSHSSLFDRRFSNTSRSSTSSVVSKSQIKLELESEAPLTLTDIPSSSSSHSAFFDRESSNTSRPSTSSGVSNSQIKLELESEAPLTLTEYPSSSSSHSARFNRTSSSSLSRSRVSKSQIKLELESESEVVEPNPKALKKERKREQNRAAALRCRERQVEKIATLESTVEMQKVETLCLTHKRDKLKEVVSFYRQEIFQHQMSGCNIDYPHNATYEVDDFGNVN